MNTTILITGGTAGIGRATAEALAQPGRTILITGRDAGRGEPVAQAIQQAKGGIVHFLAVDLASQASIRAFAARLLESYPALHVLVNNAGTAQAQRVLTEDGSEMTFAVNHLAPFLLTHLLLDRLKASAPARIINVSSLVQQWGKLHWDDLSLERGYDLDVAYNQSKLANVLFTQELARGLQGTGVTVNSLEPGLVKTGFGLHYTGWKRWFGQRIVMPLFGQTLEQGASTSVYLAQSPEVQGISGQHFRKCRPLALSAASADPAAARRLWDISARLTGLSR